MPLTVPEDLPTLDADSWSERSVWIDVQDWRQFRPWSEKFRHTVHSALQTTFEGAGARVEAAAPNGIRVTIERMASGGSPMKACCALTAHVYLEGQRPRLLDVERCVMVFDVTAAGQERASYEAFSEAMNELVAGL